MRTAEQLQDLAERQRESFVNGNRGDVWNAMELLRPQEAAIVAVLMSDTEDMREQLSRNWLARI